MFFVIFSEEDTLRSAHLTSPLAETRTILFNSSLATLDAYQCHVVVSLIVTRVSWSNVESNARHSVESGNEASIFSVKGRGKSRGHEETIGSPELALEFYRS
jgi:hypothetical protein